MNPALLFAEVQISASRRIAMAVLLLALVVMFLLGICAYQGRWRSWHGNPFFKWPYSPLACTWGAGSVLLLVTVTGLSVIVPGIPAMLVFALVIPAVLGLAVAVVYVHPPRWMLPDWVRWREGDEAVTERPACFEVHRHSKVNKIMRVLTNDDRVDL